MGCRHAEQVSKEVTDARVLVVCPDEIIYGENGHFLINSRWRDSPVGKPRSFYS